MASSFMKMIRARLFLSTVVVIVAITCYGRGSAAAHATDFKEVFNGYNDPALWSFYIKFTADIDDNKNPERSSSVSAQIKRRIAESKGVSVKVVSLTAHRYIAHQWPYSGSIPAADLSILDKKYPGCVRDIREIWGKFCRDSNDAIAQEFGWQQAKHLSQSYCAILYYTHLLADWLPPPVNNDFQFLMPVEKIVAELQRSVERMGSSDAHKQFCRDFQMKMNAALARGSSPQKQAEFVLEALKEAKLGTMLHNYYGIRGQMDEIKHPYKEDTQQQELQKAA